MSDIELVCLTSSLCANTGVTMQEQTLDGKCVSSIQRQHVMIMKRYETKYLSFYLYTTLDPHILQDSFCNSSAIRSICYRDANYQVFTSVVFAWQSSTTLTEIPVDPSLLWILMTLISIVRQKIANLSLALSVDLHSVSTQVRRLLLPPLLRTLGSA